MPYRPWETLRAPTAPDVRFGRGLAVRLIPGSTACSNGCDPAVVAGGMGRRSGPTLADRVAGAAWAEGTTDRPAVRHCWVVDAPGHPGRYAGVLLEWRRDDAGGW